jgi:hypothetical protein
VKAPLLVLDTCIIRGYRSADLSGGTVLKSIGFGISSVLCTFFARKFHFFLTKMRNTYIFDDFDLHVYLVTSKVS